MGRACRRGASGGSSGGRLYALHVVRGSGHGGLWLDVSDGRGPPGQHAIVVAGVRRHQMTPLVRRGCVRRQSAVTGSLGRRRTQCAGAQSLPMPIPDVSPSMAETACCTDCFCLFVCCFSFRLQPFREPVSPTPYPLFSCELCVCVWAGVWHRCVAWVVNGNLVVLGKFAEHSFAQPLFYFLYARE